MHPLKTGPLITRRAFTKIAAMHAVTGIAIAHQANALAQGPINREATKMVYAFAPIENGKPTNCAACRNHAVNKRFATLQAARANRAHSGCRCAIYGIPVSIAEHTRMFGYVLDRTTYDVRWVRQRKNG